MTRLVLALVAMTFLHLLLGVLVPIMLAVVLLQVARDAVAGRRTGSDERTDRRDGLLAVVLVPGLILALVAPLKAAALGVVALIERLDPGAAVTWRFVLAQPWLDGPLGVAATVLGTITLIRLGRTWTKMRHVENVPTARARSAAAGLVELRGIARPAPDEAGAPDVELRGPRVPWRSLVPDGALLYKGDNQTGDPKMTATRCTLLRPFYLEDETGRILVDPRGAEFGKAGTVTIFSVGEPPARVLLEKAQLRDGDPVYVLGVLGIRPGAPALAVDAERVVVSAVVPGTWSPRAARRGWPGRLTGHQLFLASSVSEDAVRQSLRTSLVNTLASGLVVFVSGAALVLSAAAALARP